MIPCKSLEVPPESGQLMLKGSIAARALQQGMSGKSIGWWDFLDLCTSSQIAIQDSQGNISWQSAAQVD